MTRRPPRSTLFPATTLCRSPPCHFTLTAAGGDGKGGRRGPRGSLRLLRGLPPVARLELSVDRKSTRLNSSHANISYAVFCLKKKIPDSPYDLMLTLLNYSHS